MSELDFKLYYEKLESEATERRPYATKAFKEAWSAAVYFFYLGLCYGSEFYSASRSY